MRAYVLALSVSKHCVKKSCCNAIGIFVAICVHPEATSKSERGAQGAVENPSQVHAGTIPRARTPIHRMAREGRLKIHSFLFTRTAPHLSSLPLLSNPQRHCTVHPAHSANILSSTAPSYGACLRLRSPPERGMTARAGGTCGCSERSRAGAVRARESSPPEVTRSCPLSGT